MGKNVFFMPMLHCNKTVKYERIIQLLLRSLINLPLLNYVRM